MVSILAEKPSVFKHYEQGDIFYVLFDEGGPYAYACLNFTYAPVAILHVEVKKFSHNLLKRGIKDDFSQLKFECQKKDCSALYITTPGNLAGSKKFIKFCRHFGFKDFTEHVASYQFIGE